jgi:hypothetical protein
MIAGLTALSLVLTPLPVSANGSSDSDDDNDGTLTCVGTNRNDYHPALQPYDQQVTVSGTGTFVCTSLTRPDLNNGTRYLNSSGQLNCLTGGSSSGTMTFVWNNGQSTKVTFPELSLTIRPGGQTVAILTGNVVSGPFAGGTMVYTSQLVVDDPLACLSGGVDTVAGPATINFVDL